MVRKLRIAGMTAAVLLALGACQVLFVGVFPPAAGQLTAQADLSAQVAAGTASYFRLQVVSAGGSDYVLLFTNFTFDSTKIHLLILDSRLHILNTYTLAELVALPTAGDPFSGGFAMTDLAGQVVIGNLWFDAAPDGFVFSSKSPPGFQLDHPSITGLPAYLYNEINFRITAGNLASDEYFPDWSYSNSFSPPLGTPNPAPAGQLYLTGVFADRESAAAPNVLVFRDGGSQRTYFLRIPKGDIASGYAGLVTDIFTDYGASLVVKENLDGESIAVTREGIVAYDNQEDALVRFTLDDPGSVSPLPLPRNGRMQVAAGFRGDFCVLWDPDTRALTRYEKWW